MMYMESKKGYIGRYLFYLMLLLIVIYSILVLVSYEISNVGYEMYIGWSLIALNGIAYIKRYKYGLFLTGIIFLLSTLLLFHKSLHVVCRKENFALFNFTYKYQYY